MSGKDLISKFLDSIRTEAIADLHSKKISSGDLNMKVIANDEGGDLTGDAHWYFTVHGRRPGKQPPIESILGWLHKKGITADIPERSLAFLIARKIGRVGTDIFLGKRPGLALPLIIEENKKGFKQDLKSYYRDLINSQIVEGLKKVFKQAA